MNVINQIPNKTVKIPSVNKQIIYIIGGIVLACFVVFGFGGYYLGRQSTNSQQANNLTQQIFSPVESTADVPTSSPTPQDKTVFAGTLDKNCINNKIALDKLPFTISQALKNTYKEQDTIHCSVPEESYATMTFVINTPDVKGNKREMYFFHQNSKYIGEKDNFLPLSNFNPVTINGQNYWLNVVEPGPYGISSLHVWVEIIGEKRDPISGTVVRVINTELLKDQEFIDLVKKYGVKQSDPTGPEYIILDSNLNNKTQFIQEVVNLAGQHKAFKQPAKDVTSDLNGISF